MTPILGIWASMQQAPSGSYESIATTTVGAGGSSTITFSSIPSTYKHLQVRAIARSANSVAADQTQMQFNSDTSSANYAFHYLYGNGAAAGSEGYATGTLGAIAPVVRQAGATATSGIFGVSVIDILDYANTNKYKTTRTLTGYDANGSGIIYLASGLWLSTSAINTLTLTIQGGGNYAQYSSFALYGIRG